jgi:hypothetical protein
MIYYNDIDAEIEMIHAGNTLLTPEQVQMQAGQLHNQRIDAISGYLRALSPSSGIKISAANPRDPANTASRPVFRLHYTLAENP